MNMCVYTVSFKTYLNICHLHKTVLELLIKLVHVYRYRTRFSWMKSNRFSFIFCFRNSLSIEVKLNVH